MKNVKSVIISFISLLFVGCSDIGHPNSHYAGKIIRVDVNENKKLNPQKEYSIVKMIPLQTTTDCLIQEISKLYFTDNYIIVFDQHHNNIFLFDNEGKFVRKIGVKGQGPTEYNTFNDIIYDPNTQLIYAFERFRSQMFIYNLKGELIKCVKSKYMFNSFVKCKYGYWIYSCFKQNNPNNSFLMLVDENLSEIKQEYFPHADITTVQFTPRFTINQDNGKIYFYYDYSDQIWELSDKAESVYKVDFGDLSLPYQEMKRTTQNKKNDKITHNNKHLGFISNLLISNELIYFNCMESGLNKSVSQYSVKYDFNRKRIDIYGSTTMGNEIIPASYTKPLLIKENTFVYAIEPQTMYPHEFNILKNLIGHVSEDDNPILLFLKPQTSSIEIQTSKEL